MSDYSAEADVHYLLDTTLSTHNVDLPQGVEGIEVGVADDAYNFATNNATITPYSGEKINGSTSPMTLDVDGQSVLLSFIDATQGWKVIG